MPTIEFANTSKIQFNMTQDESNRLRSHDPSGKGSFREGVRKLMAPEIKTDEHVEEIIRLKCQLQRCREVVEFYASGNHDGQTDKARKLKDKLGW